MSCLLRAHAHERVDISHLPAGGRVTPGSVHERGRPPDSMRRDSAQAVIIDDSTSSSPFLIYRPPSCGFSLLRRLSPSPARRARFFARSCRLRRVRAERQRQEARPEQRGGEGGVQQPGDPSLHNAMSYINVTQQIYVLRESYG